MSLFAKKDKSIDEEYDDRVFKPNSKSVKDIKDLKPQNRKKRKEPPKPWTKKERMVVFWIFFITIALSGVLSIYSRKGKVSGFPRVVLKVPNISIFKEDTIVVGNNSDEYQKQQDISADIIAQFDKATYGLNGLYAFYVIDLQNNFSFGKNYNEEMQAASLMKLPVMAAFYIQKEEGIIDEDTIYTLKESDKRTGAGSLASKPAGTKISYRELIELMCKQSDNTAFYIIRNLVGDDKINEAINQIGMVSTSLEDFTTTPADIGIYFEKLYSGEIIAKDDKDEMLNFLTDTIYEDWIAAGIPGVRVAHKYGREVHCVNDAGIVYADKPFVLVIMSDGIVEKEADAVIAPLSGMIFQKYTSI